MKQTYRYLDPKALSKLGSLDIQARTVVEGFIAGAHKSPYKGFSVEFAEHREYTKGDDPRHLDWKLYSKTNRYFIKQYEEETNMRVYILLDSSASMGYKSTALSKFEYACYLAASLAYLVIRQQDSAGLMVFDKTVRLFIPPRSSPTHLRQLLIQLERTRTAGTSGLGRSFHDLAERLKRRGLIVVLSDFMDEPKEILAGLAHFRHKKHEVVALQILDHFEKEFPFRGQITFRDMETDQRLKIDPPRLREQYLNELNKFLDKLKSGFSANNIDYVLADTSEPFDKTLAAYLTKRLLLR